MSRISPSGQRRLLCSVHTYKLGSPVKQSLAFELIARCCSENRKNLNRGDQLPKYCVNDTDRENRSRKEKIKSLI